MVDVPETVTQELSRPFAARGLRGRAELEGSSPTSTELRYRTIVEHPASGRRAEAVTYLDRSLTEDERRLRLLRNLVTLAGQLDPEGPWPSLPI